MSLDFGREGLDNLHVVRGRAACSRPGSLTLAHLNPPLHRHTPQWLHVVPEGGFGHDTTCFSKCGPMFPLCFGTQAFQT